MLALGLNSGSSFDGIDAVLVDIDIGEDALLKRPRFLAGKSVDWPKRVADQVLAAFENKVDSVHFDFVGKAVIVQGEFHASRKLVIGRDGTLMSV